MSKAKMLTKEDIIEQELNPERLICPVCGKRVVIPTSTAGLRYGVCSVCYERAKAAAQHYEAEYIAAQTDYNRLRRANQRTRKDTERKTGFIPEKSGAKFEDFIMP